MKAKNVRYIFSSGKALGLSVLQNLGLPVPKWVLHPASAVHLRAPLAVRSSANVEDSKASAFAGLFTSIMPVEHDRLEAAVRECSAVRPEVALHARRNNIDPATIRVDVIVQEMIEADTAGVLFTIDPSGKTDDAILSFTRGTGERLMQGEVRGKTVRLSRKDKHPLLRMGLKIEKALGHPQDIEWCEKDGKIWLLQTRPISTLEPKRDITWTRGLSEERFPAPISPLGWSILQTVLPINLVTLRKRFGLTAKRPDDVARTIRNYVYSNEKFFSIPGSMRFNPFTQTKWLREFVRGLGRYPLTVNAVRAFLLPHANEIRAAWNPEPLLREMDACNIDLSRLPLEDLRRHRARMEALARRYMEPDLAIYVVKTAASWIVEKMGGDLATLTAGVNNRTLQMNAELEQLRNGEIPLATFLERNGHLTTNWDMREPTWGEDPEIVQKLLRLPTQRTFTRATAERPKDEILAVLHDFMRIDEEHHFYCSRLYRPMRALYHEFGARLVKLGAIDRVDDVWFLTIPEIDGAFANPFHRGPLVEMRRADFERSKTARPPTRFLDQKPLDEPAGGLQGVGASPGVAEGLVRVVHTPDEVADFRPGEILVTPSPNPAWTPMYAVAGALVTATGSLLSHGLVSAREYRLPAVIGLDVRLLKTGQRIRVDGDHGVVSLVH